MFNLQGSEIIIILLLALVVLGPEKLPDAIRKFTRTYAELKKMGTGFQSEFKAAMDEPLREMRETADLVKRSADPKRIAEEADNEARLRAEADAAVPNASSTPIDTKAYDVADPAALNGLDPHPERRRGLIEPPTGAPVTMDAPPSTVGKIDVP